jgi:hypothetical protein
MREPARGFGWGAMAIWFTPRKLIGIGFRLAVVAAIVTGIYTGWQEMVRVRESELAWERIWSRLRCAAGYDDAAVERVLHPLGNYNISLLGCGSGDGPGGAFIASRTEIEQARRNERTGMDTVPASWAMVFNTAGATFILVNLVALLAALAWVVLRWVLFGRKVET